MSENTDKLAAAGYFPEQAENIDGRLMKTKSNPPDSEGHYIVHATRPDRAKRQIVFSGLMAANSKALELIGEGYTVSVESEKSWTAAVTRKLKRNPARKESPRRRRSKKYLLIASRVGSPLVNRQMPSLSALTKSAKAYEQMGYHVRVYVLPYDVRGRSTH